MNESTAKLAKRAADHKGMKQCWLEKTLPGGEDAYCQMAWLPARHAVKGTTISLADDGHGWEIKEVYG